MSGAIQQRGPRDRCLPLRPELRLELCRGLRDPVSRSNCGLSCQPPGVPGGRYKRHPFSGRRLSAECMTLLRSVADASAPLLDPLWARLLGGE
eukprot:2754078-Alexandrium_andersonii.AAC.1